MKKVLVLLSTYNGERYLKEQIDSLFAQHGIELHLLIRDDGSTDHTKQIIESYKQERPNITTLFESNIGASNSFFRLIDYSVRNMPPYDYYAFSDQDDVWMDGKLYSAVTLLDNSPNQYRLSYSAYCPTDERLNPLNVRNITICNSLGANIVSNHILGCTQVFNRDLLMKINLINNDLIKQTYKTIPSYHDSWATAVAYSIGGDVICDPVIRMYYRQHGNNVIGAAQGLLPKIRRRLRVFFKHTDCPRNFRCKCIQTLMWDDVADCNKKFIDCCANYKTSFRKKLDLLFSNQIREQGIANGLGAFFMILVGKF